MSLPSSAPFWVFSACALGTVTAGCPDPTTSAELTRPGAPVAVPTQGQTNAPNSAGYMSGTPGEVLTPDSFAVKSGKGVELSGTIKYSGAKTGVYRIDILQREGDLPPALAKSLELTGTGPWSIHAPKDYGNVYLVAFLDIEGDGPSKDDPAALHKGIVDIGVEDISDLDFTLSQDADLGPFTPGEHGPPPTVPTNPIQASAEGGGEAGAGAEGEGGGEGAVEGAVEGEGEQQGPSVIPTGDLISHENAPTHQSALDYGEPTQDAAEVPEATEAPLPQDAPPASDDGDRATGPSQAPNGEIIEHTEALPNAGTPETQAPVIPEENTE